MTGSFGNESERGKKDRTVEEFEEMLRKGQTRMMSVRTFEYLLDYYLVRLEYTRALQVCDTALKQHSSEVNIIIQKSLILTAVGNTEEALAFIETVSNLRPGDPDLLLEKARVLTEAGEYEAAVEVYESLLPFTAEKEEIYCLMAMAYRDLAEFNKALICYMRATDPKQIDLEILEEIEDCCLEMGNLEKMTDIFEKLIDEEPYSKEAWLFLGRSLIKRGMHEEALKAYEYSTLIDDEYGKGYFGTGHSLMNLRKYEEAHEAYRMALVHTESPDADIYCHLGASLEKQERYSEALAFYRKGVKLDEEAGRAWFGIGLCLYELDYFSEAVNALKKALTLRKEESAYWRLLANAEQAMGLLNSALEHYEQANILEPEEPEIWLEWSEAFFDEGEVEKALDIVKDALEVLPDEPSLFYRTAAYLMYAGKHKEALNYLETALTLNFDAYEDFLEFFTEVEVQKALYKVILSFKKNDDSE